MVSEDGIHEETRTNPLITKNQQQTTNINYKEFISITTKGYKLFPKIRNSFL